MAEGKEVTMEVQCKDCRGTGVYKGFAEPEGVGVVCLTCNGTGAMKLKYISFTGRKRRDGIRYVRRSRGSLLAVGVGPTGGQVSYEDFLAGKLPD